MIKMFGRRRLMICMYKHQFIKYSLNNSIMEKSYYCLPLITLESIVVIIFHLKVK